MVTKDSIPTHSYNIVLSLKYCIVENIRRRKHWWIQLLRLFGRENFSEWTTIKILILNFLWIWGRKLWWVVINSPNSLLFSHANISHNTVYPYYITNKLKPFILFITQSSCSFKYATPTFITKILCLVTYVYTTAWNDLQCKYQIVQHYSLQSYYVQL